MKSYKLILIYYLLVRRRADIDFQRLAARLEFVGYRDIVPEHAVARHLHPDDPCKHRPSVNSNTHLEGIIARLNGAITENRYDFTVADWQIRTMD